MTPAERNAAMDRLDVLDEKIEEAEEWMIDEEIDGAEEDCEVSEEVLARLRNERRELLAEFPEIKYVPPPSEPQTQEPEA